ncbi:hypothetical protein HYU22_03930 [Candidatus Woesearchaeota archaeon]|nr:hypothetical protein [Candidatus Woesearchaeota archaeon]
MGIIYSITRHLPLGKWQGAYPTTLEELVEKSEMLWAKGVEIQNIRIVPALTEIQEDPLGIIQQTPYGIDVLMRYTDGKERHVREPLPPEKVQDIVEKKEGIEHALFTHAEYIRKMLHSSWPGTPVLVYGPNGHSHDGAATMEPER